MRERERERERYARLGLASEFGLISKVLVKNRGICSGLGRSSESYVSLSSYHCVHDGIKFGILKSICVSCDYFISMIIELLMIWLLPKIWEVN